MAFSEQQTRALSAKLSAKHVRTREANGETLVYIEGWHAIAEANRIFGFEGWDRTTLSADCVWSGTHRGAYVCTYTARVRVTVQAGERSVTREGCGSGEGKGQTPGEAHDVAMKAAETDATKRALATFGNPFGLALYDKDLKGVRNAARIQSVNGTDRDKRLPLRPMSSKAPVRSFDQPATFAAALQATLNQATTIDALFELWHRNIESVRALESRRDKAGPAAVRQLVAHFKARAAAIAGRPGHQPEKAGQAPNGQDRSDDRACAGTIDKSVLAIGAPRRLRSKAHLRYVASQPCLLCGRRPSQAHHLRFAQPQALGRKVSDEFTVPLCGLHHRQLHAVGDERQWWQTHKIDPLPVARRLWSEHNGHASDMP